MVLGMEDDRSPFLRTRLGTLRWYAWHPYARAALGVVVLLPALARIIAGEGVKPLVTGPAASPRPRPEP